jgi:hypothetical protein
MIASSSSVRSVSSLITGICSPWNRVFVLTPANRHLKIALKPSIGTSPSASRRFNAHDLPVPLPRLARSFALVLLRLRRLVAPSLRHAERRNLQALTRHREIVWGQPKGGRILRWLGGDAQAAKRSRLPTFLSL